MAVQVLPEKLLQSLQDVPGFDKVSFQRVHESGEQVTSVRFNPSKFSGDVNAVFEGAIKIPWSSFGYYLPERPSFTLDPLLHAGAYYVQEASGMFLEYCIKQCADISGSIKVLDLCAAPGGKSTVIQSLISNESLLVSNEVIKPRVNILSENMIKWGGENTVVTNNDPRDFSRLRHFFDVIVVDAPCSGSGLFRKDPWAIDEWSEELVNTCSLRQQRILGDVLPALKPSGILIYSTCSYSEKEDEDICDWLTDEGKLSSVPIAVPSGWNITPSYSRKNGVKGFRFYPNKIMGEGFFIACFKKEKEEEAERMNYKQKLTRLSAKEEVIIHPLLKKPGKFRFYHLDAGAFAFPETLEHELIAITASLYVKRAGVLCGKPAHESFIPDHELARSTIINDK
ncbi:MAG: RsmB/NOP family class I SAM-dependent RNA methyltransferase, partial [Flavitalea sp.]